MNPMSVPERSGGQRASIPASGIGIDLVAGFQELGIVHQTEQANLLRAAARLACANTRRGRLYVAVSRRSVRDMPPRGDRSTWREACLDEIALADSDGFDLHPLLRVLSRTAVHRWPNPAQLALAALRLARSHAGILDLARACIAEGRLAEGIGIVRDLLVEQPLAADRQEAFEALALAFEATGAVARSLGWYEAAVGSRGSNLRVAVSMLSLALRHGDAARIEIASERLRPLVLSVPGTRSRFFRALGSAMSRAAADREAHRAGPSLAARDAIRRLALGGSGAEAEVAQALLAN
jgi:hypothetical protein